jgi:hypothetical protein
VIAHGCADCRVDGERDELAGYDHELIQCDDSAALLRRSEFREIRWHHHGSAADSEPEHEPAGGQRLPVGRQAAADRSDNEDHRDRQDSLPPAESISDPTTHYRAQRGSQQQCAGDQSLIGCGQMQFPAHVEESAVDDTRIVTKQQAAEGCDDGNEGELGARVVG